MRFGIVARNCKRADTSIAMGTYYRSAADQRTGVISRNRETTSSLRCVCIWSIYRSLSFQFVDVEKSIKVLCTSVNAWCMFLSRHRSSKKKSNRHASCAFSLDLGKGNRHLREAHGAVQEGLTLVVDARLLVNGQSLPVTSFSFWCHASLFSQHWGHCWSFLSRGSILICLTYYVRLEVRRGQGVGVLISYAGLAGHGVSRGSSSTLGYSSAMGYSQPLDQGLAIEFLIGSFPVMLSRLSSLNRWP